MSLLPWRGGSATTDAAAARQPRDLSASPLPRRDAGRDRAELRPGPETFAPRAAARTLEQKHERNCGLKTEFDAAVLRVFQIGEQLRESIRDTVESAGKTLIHLEQTTDAVRKVKQFYDGAFDENADPLAKQQGGPTP